MKLEDIIFFAGLLLIIFCSYRIARKLYKTYIKQGHNRNWLMVISVFIFGLSFGILFFLLVVIFIYSFGFSR